MERKELKRIEKLIKKSREEIGDRYEELSKKYEEDVRKKLGEEKYRVWLAANGSEEDEQKLIDEIGKERYTKLFDEMFEEIMNYNWTIEK